MRPVGYYEAFVSATHHCTAKITNMRRSDSTLISFALEEDAETDEGIHLESTDPVNAAITALASNRHVLKPRFPEQSLA